MFVDYTETEKCIELADGTEYAIPERTAELYDKYTALGKKVLQMSEYQYYKAMLELLFGKEAFRKIAPKGTKESLDRLGRICIAAEELFTRDKSELEREQIDKNVEKYSGLVEANRTLSEITK